MEQDNGRVFAAELVGTAVLMIGGPGTAVLAGGSVGTLGVAIAFGLSLLVMAYVIGPISGCHINPAVTLALFLTRKIGAANAVFSVLGQLIGAAIGGAIVPERNKAKYPRWPRLNAAAGATRKWVETRAPLLAAPARWAATVTRPLRVYSGQARMTDAQRARLEAAFKESNTALATWLDRKLPWGKG